MTGACKDLKERILNSKEYLEVKKREEDDFNYSKKIDQYKEEILSWFEGLPEGYYIIHGPIYKFKQGWLKKDRVKQNTWRVWVRGSTVQFERYKIKPDDHEIEWIIANKEQVCENIKYDY